MTKQPHRIKSEVIERDSEGRIIRIIQIHENSRGKESTWEIMPGDGELSEKAIACLAQLLLDLANKKGRAREVKGGAE